MTSRTGRSSQTTVSAALEDEVAELVWYVPSQTQPSRLASRPRRAAAAPPARSSPSSGRARARRSRRVARRAARASRPRDASCPLHARPDDDDARHKPELAARDDDRRAADLDSPPASGRPRRASTAARSPRPGDLDLVAEPDPSVPGEVERERPRGRAGRRILGDPVRRDEDARLPALAVAREAAVPYGPSATARRGRAAAPPPPPASRARRRRAAGPLP